MDGKHNIPTSFNSFEILNENVAKVWIETCENPSNWKMVEILEGDIEEPTFIEHL